MAGAERELIQHFFSAEDSRRKRNLLLIWTFVILVDILLIAAYIQTQDIQGILSMLWPVLLIALILLYFVLVGSLRSQQSMEGRLNALLDTMELSWDDVGELDVSEERRSLILDAFANKTISGGRVNADYRRTRGTDEKGPAFGDDKSAFQPSAQRRDPATHEQDYDGLEGPLGTAESLVEEANQSYAARAQERWEASEKADVDLIEAGVDRLGDLVKTDWFQKNAKDGAVKELMEQDEPV